MYTHIFCVCVYVVQIWSHWNAVFGNLQFRCQEAPVEEDDGPGPLKI